MQRGNENTEHLSNMQLITSYSRMLITNSFFQIPTLPLWHWKILQYVIGINLSYPSSYLLIMSYQCSLGTLDNRNPPHLLPGTFAQSRAAPKFSGNTSLICLKPKSLLPFLHVPQTWTFLQCFLLSNNHRNTTSPHIVFTLWSLSPIWTL